MFSLHQVVEMGFGAGAAMQRLLSKTKDRLLSQCHVLNYLLTRSEMGKALKCPWRHTRKSSSCAAPLLPQSWQQLAHSPLCQPPRTHGTAAAAARAKAGSPNQLFQLPLCQDTTGHKHKVRQRGGNGSREALPKERSSARHRHLKLGPPLCC